MFVRKKKNRSGTTSVVVVDKHGGKFKELCTIGIGHSDEEIDALCVKGRSWIKNRLGILEFDFEGPENKAQELANAESMLNNIDSVLLNGAKLILDKVYNSIGFNRIADDTLRHLVVARLCQPMSKMATVDYLKSHFDEDVNLSKIYRKEVTGWLDTLERKDGLYHERVLDNGDRLIVTYSSKRAAKDAYNRERGVERLRREYASGKVTKDNINKRGYSKFLKIENDVLVGIQEEKILEDSKWDGLKGYVTNTQLPAEEVIAQYRGLWVVERAFRISKGTIETRPIFHFTERRIEAHICLCFVAYKVYKELERIITLLQLNMSVDTVIQIAKTITTIRLRLPMNDKTIEKTMMLTPEQQSIKPLFDHLGV